MPSRGKSEVGVVPQNSRVDSENSRVDLKNSRVNLENSRVNLAVRVVRAAIHKTNNKQSAYLKASTFAKATVDKSAR